MAVQIFNNLNDLLTYVNQELPTNGNQEITALRHREVMQSTILSLLSIVTTIPPTTVNQFPLWSNSEEYTGGQEVIVRYLGKLWLFVSASNNIGTEPSTNATVWREISAIELAHLRGRDEYLDQGGPYEVSAQQLHALVYGGAPPLASVLLSDPSTGEHHIVLQRAIRADVTEYPGGSSTVVLDLTRSTHRVSRSGSVTIDYSLWETDQEYVLVIYNGGGVDLDVHWASGKWSKTTGLSIPSSVPVGRCMVVRFRQASGTLGCLITEAHSGFENV